MIDDPVAVYRLFDSSDDLLYVGISNDPDERWRAHRWGPDRMPWVEQVGRRTVEWQTSRAAALEMEAQAIKSERPKYNGKHNYDDAPFDPTTWGEVTSKHKVPIVAELMRSEIATGRWGTGQRLPALRLLAAAARVSVRIVSKASVTLQDDGILIFRSGHGLFVASLNTEKPRLPYDWPRSLGFPG